MDLYIQISLLRRVNHSSISASTHPTDLTPSIRFLGKVES